MCYVENEDAVGAAPTGDASTTSELATILLPALVRLILEVYGELKLSIIEHPFNILKIVSNTGIGDVTFAQWEDPVKNYIKKHHLLFVFGINLRSLKPLTYYLYSEKKSVV